MSWRYTVGTCTTCHYICAVIDCISCVARHIVFTSKNEASSFAGKGSPRRRIHSNLPDRNCTLDDIMHVQFAIVTFGTVGL